MGEGVLQGCDLDGAEVVGVESGREEESLSVMVGLWVVYFGDGDAVLVYTFSCSGYRMSVRRKNSERVDAEEYRWCEWKRFATGFI